MEESLHQETPSKHSETPTEKDAPKIEYPSESNPSQIKMKQILFKKKKSFRIHRMDSVLTKLKPLRVSNIVLWIQQSLFPLITWSSARQSLRVTCPSQHPWIVEFITRFLSSTDNAFLLNSLPERNIQTSTSSITRGQLFFLSTKIIY